PYIQYFRLRDNEDNLITMMNPQNKTSLLGLDGSFEFDKRDDEHAPLKGYYAEIGGTFFPKVFNNYNRFSKLRGDVRTYLYMNTFTDITLALRVQGEKLFVTLFP